MRNPVAEATGRNGRRAMEAALVQCDELDRTTVGGCTSQKHDGTYGNEDDVRNQRPLVDPSAVAPGTGPVR